MVGEALEGSFCHVNHLTAAFVSLSKHKLTPSPKGWECFLKYKLTNNYHKHNVYKFCGTLRILYKSNFFSTNVFSDNTDYL